MKNALTASLAGKEFRRCFAEATKWNYFELPEPKVWISATKVDSLDWKTKVASSNEDSTVHWSDENWNLLQCLDLAPASELTTFKVPIEFSSIAQAFTLIEPLPFEVCSIASPFFHEWIAADYPRWGFGRSHIDHGWGCAFRGAGHDRLVSRRWLDFGPWRVIRRPDDTTFIQFHDLDITDPAEAYAQAAPGHERMGNSATGGYLQHQLDWIIGDVNGLHDTTTQTLQIVGRRTVSQEDMLSSCALRLKHRLTIPATDPTRINTIAYVFLAREDADAHLHELWLRELQCWYVDERGKHRLDDSYHPVPNPPDWVKRLKERDPVAQAGQIRVSG